MFCTEEKDSELRLIDFGSGTMDGLEGSERGNSDSNVDDTDRHHTFAGKPVFSCRALDDRVCRITYTDTDQYIGSMVRRSLYQSVTWWVVVVVHSLC